MADVTVTADTVAILQEIAEDPKAQATARVAAVKELERIRAETNPRRPDPGEIDVPQDVILLYPMDFDAEESPTPEPPPLPEPRQTWYDLRPAQ